jgi:hypothetical protein
MHLFSLACVLHAVPISSFIYSITDTEHYKVIGYLIIFSRLLVSRLDSRIVYYLFQMFESI